MLQVGSLSRRLWESPPIPTERYERRPCYCHVRCTCRSLDFFYQGARENGGWDGWREQGAGERDGGSKGREGGMEGARGGREGGSDDVRQEGSGRGLREGGLIMEWARKGRNEAWTEWGKERRKEASRWRSGKGGAIEQGRGARV